MLRTWIIISNLVETLKQEEGQGLLEYSFLFIFIVMILIGALSTLGFTVQTVLYDKLATQLFAG